MNPRLRIETWGTRLNCATNSFTATGLLQATCSSIYGAGQMRPEDAADRAEQAAENSVLYQGTTLVVP